MNNLNLIGRLTKDPELRSVSGRNGEPVDVCDLRIAYDQRDGSTGHLDVVTFGGAAAACATYLSKGRQIAVSGELRFREWEGEGGEKRSRHSVAGRVEFLGSRAAGENGNARGEFAGQPGGVAGGETGEAEDIPF